MFRTFLVLASLTSMPTTMHSATRIGTSIIDVTDARSILHFSFLRIPPTVALLHTSNLRCIHIEFITSNLRNSPLLLGRHLVEFSPMANSCFLNIFVSYISIFYSVRDHQNIYKRNSTSMHDKGELFQR